jgi:hypothetical protein
MDDVATVFHRNTMSYLIIILVLTSIVISSYIYKIQYFMIQRAPLNGITLGLWDLDKLILLTNTHFSINSKQVIKKMIPLTERTY